MNLNDKLTFGKYKNETLLEVIIKDANYILWALNNVSFFSIDEDALVELHRKINNVKSSYRKPKGYHATDYLKEQDILDGISEPSCLWEDTDAFNDYDFQ